MDEIGNSASEEMPELTEIFENKNNNKIPEEKMAALYATVIKKNIYEEYDEEYGVKPIFILESDIFGSYKPKPQEFITHNEIYKAIDEQVSARHLKGIQRVRGLWRIYPDNEDDKNALVTNGLTIRNMLIQFYTRNPKVAAREKPDHYRIRVKDVPCSADDGQIYRYLEKQLMCVIHNHYRERLRVDGFLTNCHTGDRIFICDNPANKKRKKRISQSLMIRVMMLVEKPNMKLRVIRTAMRETKKNHSQLLNLRRKIKTVTKLKHYRTKQKTSQKRRQKAKQTVKICQTCLNVKTKQKEDRKNKVSQLKVHWMFI